MPKKIGKFAESYADEAGITAKKAKQKNPKESPSRAPAPESAPDAGAGEDVFKVRVDPRNYRIHPEKNKKLIRKSLSENGAGRSIVVDKTGASIGGSGVLEQANQLGLKQRIVETDGSELVVVVRKDIAPDDPRRKQLALADNATTDQSEWDEDLLKADWTAEELDGWGVDGIFDSKPEAYTQKIDGLTYEPTGEKVSVTELFDANKYRELVSEIEQTPNLAKEVKEMLIVAASRHIVFDYRKMAEYYAQASPEIQRLMEKSALVIIDFESAIQNGFVALSAALKEAKEQSK